MDELNHDFQALALEGRVMGEVRVHILNHYVNNHLITYFLSDIFIYF